MVTHTYTCNNSGRELVHIHTVLLEKLHTVCREFLNDCMQNVSLAGFAPLAPYLQADMNFHFEH